MSSVINHRFDSRHWPHPSGGFQRPATVLVVVDGIADVVDGAVGYALALQPTKCLAVHVRRSRRDADSISRAWAAFHPGIPLGVVDRGVGSIAAALAPVIANQRPTAEQPVVVIVPNDPPAASGLSISDGAVELVSAFDDSDDVLVVSVSSACGPA
jgi:hypothetical protein